MIFGHQHPVSEVEGLTIKAGREDKPEFPRSYEVQLTDEVHMTIETKDYGLGGRSVHGELRQRNGSTVWFEPERPADRILDRDLLPHVEGWCERILRMDREFARALPDEFIDEAGQKWVRA